MKSEVKEWWESLYIYGREYICDRHDVILHSINDEEIVKMYDYIANHMN